MIEFAINFIKVKQIYFEIIENLQRGSLEYKSFSTAFVLILHIYIVILCNKFYCFAAYFA